MNAKQLYLYAKSMATRKRARLCVSIGTSLLYKFYENNNVIGLRMSLACMKKANKLYDKAIEQIIAFRNAMNLKD